MSIRDEVIVILKESVTKLETENYQLRKLLESSFKDNYIVYTTIDMTAEKASEIREQAWIEFKTQNKI